MLATYIFESLVTSGQAKAVMPEPHIPFTDEQLGFEAATAAIGLKVE